MYHAFPFKINFLRHLLFSALKGFQKFGDLQVKEIYDKEYKSKLLTGK